MPYEEREKWFFYNTKSNPTDSAKAANYIVPVGSWKKKWLKWLLPSGVHIFLNAQYQTLFTIQSVE